MDLFGTSWPNICQNRVPAIAQPGEDYEPMPMWPEPLPNTFPSNGQTIFLKILIDKFESDLQAEYDIINDARQRISALKEGIAIRRAWIAPIRKLPVEILSEIFVHCRTVSWLAPVKISEVCRLWRQVVLSTPRAWTSIHFRVELGPANMQCYLSTFIKRSNPHLLHLRVPGDSNWTYFSPNLYSSTISEHFNRIFCLYLPGNEIMISGVRLPKLTHLNLWRSNDMPLRITRSKFPSLVYLNCPGYKLEQEENDAEYPPLHFLSFFADIDQKWVQVVKGLSPFLKSLTVFGHTLSDGVKPVTTVEFPMLKYLAFNSNLHGPTRLSPIIRAVTPKLVSLELKMQDSQLPVSLHDDVGGVLHLRTDNTSQLAKYSSLRVLQLQILPKTTSKSLIDKANEFIEPLRTDANICPALETVDVFTHSLGTHGCEKWKESKVESKKSVLAPRPCIEINVVDVRNALPGSREDFKCEASTSCRPVLLA